jgi:hypothetical protein
LHHQAILKWIDLKYLARVTLGFIQTLSKNRIENTIFSREDTITNLIIKRWLDMFVAINKYDKSLLWLNIKIAT